MRKVYRFISSCFFFLLLFFAVFSMMSVCFSEEISAVVNPMDEARIIGKSLDEIVAEYGVPDFNTQSDIVGYRIWENGIFAIRFEKMRAASCYYESYFYSSDQFWIENFEKEQNGISPLRLDLSLVRVGVPLVIALLLFVLFGVLHIVVCFFKKRKSSPNP